MQKKSIETINKEEQADSRNNKIASILTFLITITHKIEKLKQKLCGFSAQEFSPEQFYEALDLTEKGYLDTSDIIAFLGNGHIKEKDILILFNRVNCIDQSNDENNKLTYLGYLNLIKPYFDHEKGKDILMRDTIVRRHQASSSNQKLHQIQQNILLLLNQLILLNCISIAEHQDLKMALMDEYMLNVSQINQIVGLENNYPIKAIHKFIVINSQYDVGQDEVKFLLAFLQTHEQRLGEERYLKMMFIPTKVKESQKFKAKQIEKHNPKDLLKVPQHYHKTYINKNDLISNSKKWMFLDYIHPNSLNQHFQIKEQRRHIIPTKDDDEKIVREEHKKLNISEMRASIKQLKQPKNFNQQKGQQSFVGLSNFYRPIQQKIKQDYISPSYKQYKQYELDTPILEQFMHDSNIKHNLGTNKFKKSNLNTLIQREEVERNNSFNEDNSSDAFVIIDYNLKKKPIEQYEKISKKYKDIEGQKDKKPINQIFQTQKTFIHSLPQNRSQFVNKSHVNQQSGILNQFLRRQQ